MPLNAGSGTYAQRAGDAMIRLIVLPLTLVALASPAIAQPPRTYLDVNYVGVESQQNGRTDILPPQRIVEIGRRTIRAHKARKAVRASTRLTRGTTSSARTSSPKMDFGMSGFFRSKSLRSGFTSAAISRISSRGTSALAAWSASVAGVSRSSISSSPRSRKSNSTPVTCCLGAACGSGSRKTHKQGEIRAC
jgi:hypothetical protein